MVCEAGGGLSDESRMGGSMSWVDDERRDLRLGDVDVGEILSSGHVFFFWERSVVAKLCVVGVSGGVAWTGEDDKMIVFLHASHIPRADFIGSLQVLQMATVVESESGSWG